MSKQRPAAVSGRFYPGRIQELRELVSTLFRGAAEGVLSEARAVVLPHAGYAYSGRTAALALSRIVVPERIIIACPNHTGHGAAMSLWSGGAWQLPTGKVPVDAALVEALMNATPLELDRDAHLREHAIEVELPLLQHRQPALRIAPLCLGPLSLGDCQRLGAGIAAAVRAVESRDTSVLLVASTDMSHYVPAGAARELDAQALDQMTALDPAGLYATVRRHGISMCGVVPTTTLLYAARALGATSAELVDYTNSGERTGDDQNVVGYASVIVY